MSTIHILPESLANRIAAGEVVERPASVVKELLENSVDAGATRIEVTLRDGGKKFIEVMDNGCGMSEEDAVLAVQRFATSKISTEEDLEAIDTLGFRGEALPSIGAVSQMKITTRPRDSTEGVAILVEGGEITDMRAVGCPVGTTVAVANLFYNTPARRKFLATSATERGHCLDWISRLALAYPEIAFQVTHNEAVLFTSPGSGDMRSVLATVYGSNTARHFLPLSLEVEGLGIHGFISGPQVTRANRHHQLFFVNRRFVRSRILSHALTGGYGMLLPSGKQPLCAICLEIDPHQVDPNVHPTKIEVRFKASGEVHNLVQQTVEQALAEGGYRSLSQQVAAEKSSDERFLPAGRLQPSGPAVQGRIQRLRVNPFFDEVDQREAGIEVHAAPVGLAEEAGLTPGPSPFRRGETAEVPEPPEQPAPLPEADITVLGQMSGKYILVQQGQDLLLIDQHRAAERVIFERLQAQPRRLVRQLLAVPLTLELTAEQLAAVEQHQELLAEAGFELEPFGGNSYVIRSVPAQLASGNPEEALDGLISDLAQWQTAGDLDSQREELLATIACHSAVKAGEHLIVQEMTGLVADLIQTQAPAVCPHGDPIIVTITGEQLDRKFERG